MSQKCEQRTFSVFRAWESNVMKAKYLTEEKERERYELRERNSELRLQVYELEKRSQLLSQSLQVRFATCIELKSFILI